MPDRCEHLGEHDPPARARGRAGRARDWPTFDLAVPWACGDRTADRVHECSSGQGRPFLPDQKTDANDAKGLAQLLRTGFFRPVGVALLQVWRATRTQVLELDRLATAVAKRDPNCRRWMTAPGVGTITALAYVAAVERPEEFKNGRAVSAWVGLTPTRYQSGQIDIAGRISRQGDTHLRTYLYEAANTVLTRSRADTAIKRWGLALKVRVGHKRAVVAVARKLAVVLHAMWAKAQPFRTDAITATA